METKEQLNQLKKESEEHAKSSGIKLNSNEKIINGILSGLLRNKKLKGKLYCPCRVLTGIKERNDEIICPCVFHRGEIEINGRCHCNLFLRE